VAESAKEYWKVDAFEESCDFPMDRIDGLVDESFGEALAKRDARSRK
jgi:hypothetical protein